MADLILYCLVDGESTSSAFPVEIAAAMTVGQLKKAIKAEKSPEFNDIAADKLTLWKVSLPNGTSVSALSLGSLPSDSTMDELLNARTPVSGLFPERLRDNDYIIVQRPPPASKRPLEDAGEGPSSKRHRPDTMKDAITSAGLAKKAIVDGEPGLSTLNSRERAMVLEHLGQHASRDNKYYSLPKTALALQKEHADLQENGVDFPKIGDYIQSLEILSAPPDTLFPIVDAGDLYIREDYKNLYEEITTSFTDNPLSSRQNRIIVTGTPGIGKSTFLVYFVVRLLAESDNGKPPIIVFQKKQSTTCFVYGGTSVVRKGDITVFADLLDLPETWYLSDSSKTPILESSKSIMCASPKTLMDTYKEAAKEGASNYNMPPWELDELEECRSKVASFKMVEKEFLKELYAKIGGIPRSVLETPSIELGRGKNAILRHKKTEAEKAAYGRVKEAINFVQDPHKLLECFANGRDSLQFSGRILHRWPIDNHKNFYLRWGSDHIQNEIIKCLEDKSWAVLLQSLVHGGQEISKGPLFELYVHHIFRQGGLSFEIKALEDGRVCDLLHIPAESPVRYFRTVEELSALSVKWSKMPLFIPTISNFPCIDLALAPDKLFQVTVSLEHPIKQAPLKDIVQAILGEKPDRNAHVGLYFVVPNSIYDKFKVQSYSTATGGTSKNVPGIVTRRVKQYALKVDLDSALAMESPGSKVAGGSGKVRRR